MEDTDNAGAAHAVAAVDDHWSGLDALHPCLSRLGSFRNFESIFNVFSFPAVYLFLLSLFDFFPLIFNSVPPVGHGVDLQHGAIRSLWH
jgi:hypothetical protein